MRFRPETVSQTGSIWRWCSNAIWLQDSEHAWLVLEILVFDRDFYLRAILHRLGESFPKIFLSQLSRRLRQPGIQDQLEGENQIGFANAVLANYHACTTEADVEIMKVAKVRYANSR
jgi:hypothetical protein